ncbi:MAG: hypothetical protein ABIO80_08785 [Sphingomicrobium sp.]
MTIDAGAHTFSTASGDPAYLRRRAVEEARAAVGAKSLASTLIHVELATAFARRCRDVADRAWVAQHRIW